MSTTIDFAPAETRSEPVSGSPSPIIGRVGGPAAPGVGVWQVRCGPPLTLRAARLRRRAVPARATGGEFVVSEELLGSSLDFSFELADTGCAIRLSTEVVRIVAEEQWEAHGTAGVAGQSQRVSARIRNNGIFRQRGRQPSLWLTLESTLQLPKRPGVDGSPLRRFTLTCDLTLNHSEATLPLCGQLRANVSAALLSNS